MGSNKNQKIEQKEYRGLIKNILEEIGAIEYCSCWEKRRLTGKLDDGEISKLVEEKLKKLGEDFDKAVLNKILAETPFDNKCERCEEIDD